MSLQLRGTLIDVPKWVVRLDQTETNLLKARLRILPLNGGEGRGLIPPSMWPSACIVLCSDLVFNFFPSSHPSMSHPLGRQEKPITRSAWMGPRVYLTTARPTLHDNHVDVKKVRHRPNLAFVGPIGHDLQITDDSTRRDLY